MQINLTTGPRGQSLIRVKTQGFRAFRLPCDPTYFHRVRTDPASEQARKEVLNYVALRGSDAQREACWQYY